MRCAYKWLFTAVGGFALANGQAQLASRTASPGAATVKTPTLRRTRLILKDGSYQIVMSFTVVGKNIQYVSAERGGETELIPMDMVDLPATKKWESQHLSGDSNGERPEPAIDPELLREEREKALLSPEVAPDLRLAPEDAVLALDSFRAIPQLVPMMQTDGELNKQTGHSILRSVIKPQASAHQLVVLKGEKAPVQFHVDQPEFYLKMDDDLPAGGPSVLTVNTHGAKAESTKVTAANDYVILRVDVRQEARVLASFSMTALQNGKRQEDVFETTLTALPGGHWLKIVPQEKLLVGEYALVELLDDKTINLGVWDFGIHPTAPENRDVLLPEKKRPIRLEKHPSP